MRAVTHPIPTRQHGPALIPVPRDISGLTIPEPPVPWATLRGVQEMACWSEPTPAQARSWWLRFWRIVA